MYKVVCFSGTRLSKVAIVLLKSDVSSSVADGLHLSWIALTALPLTPQMIWSCGTTLAGKFVWITGASSGRNKGSQRCERHLNVTYQGFC